MLRLRTRVRRSGPVELASQGDPGVCFDKGPQLIQQPEPQEDPSLRGAQAKAGGPDPTGERLPTGPAEGEAGLGDTGGGVRPIRDHVAEPCPAPARAPLVGKSHVEELWFGSTFPLRSRSNPLVLSRRG